MAVEVEEANLSDWGSMRGAGPTMTRFSKGEKVMHFTHF